MSCPIKANNYHKKMAIRLINTAGPRISRKLRLKLSKFKDIPITIMIS